MTESPLLDISQLLEQLVKKGIDKDTIDAIMDNRKPSLQTHKICNKCRVEKHKTEFYHNVLYGDGYNTKCKACVKIYYTTKRDEKKKMYELAEQLEQTKFEEPGQQWLKDIADAESLNSVSSGIPDRINSNCEIKALLDDAAASTIIPPEPQDEKVEDVKIKWCKRCLKELPLSEFYQVKGTADGKGNFCRTCLKKQRVDYDLRIHTLRHEAFQLGITHAEMKNLQRPIIKELQILIAKRKAKQNSPQESSSSEKQKIA
jgi:hypothetical protein